MSWPLPLLTTGVAGWPPEVWGGIIAAVIVTSGTIAVALINRKTTKSNEKDTDAITTIAKLTAEVAALRSENRWLRKQVEK